MTVEEMRKAILDKCLEIPDCYVEKCPLLRKGKANTSYSCFGKDLTDEEIKENYELMFGKEESEMKNEFKMEDIKAGYLVRIKEDNALLLAIQSKNEMDFYDETLCYVCSESDMGFNDSNEYCIIEVYGYYDDAELFGISDRPLLYKKENMNFKEYKFGDITIIPNFKEGYIRKDEDNEGIIYVEESREDMVYPDDITIKKSELDDVINALTEIRDFIKEDE